MGSAKPPIMGTPMRYAFTLLFALQIILSPVCMTQMARAQEASPDTGISMSGHDHATQMMNHAAHGTSQQKPCDQDGDCFSRASLQSALSPDQQLPLFAVAALPITPLTLANLSDAASPLPSPEDPPPIVTNTQTVVLLQ